MQELRIKDVNQSFVYQINHFGFAVSYSFCFLETESPILQWSFKFSDFWRMGVIKNISEQNGHSYYLSAQDNSQQYL